MTDKEKIRNIIELFIAWNGETDVIDVANIDSAVEFIVGSLQEEPVSIWHDSNKEQPNCASTVAVWYPKYKNGEIISRCVEVYSDRIWAYIDDLLKM